jgi:hypothetical protein
VVVVVVDGCGLAVVVVVARGRTVVVVVGGDVVVVVDRGGAVVDVVVVGRGAVVLVVDVVGRAATVVVVVDPEGSQITAGAGDAGDDGDPDPPGLLVVGVTRGAGLVTPKRGASITDTLVSAAAATGPSMSGPVADTMGSTRAGALASSSAMGAKPSAEDDESDAAGALGLSKLPITSGLLCAPDAPAMTAPTAPVPSSKRSAFREGIG